MAIGQDPAHGRGRGMLHCIDATQNGRHHPQRADLDLRRPGPHHRHGGGRRRPGLRGRHRRPAALRRCRDRPALLGLRNQGRGLGRPAVADGKLFFGNKKDFYIMAAGKQAKLLSKIRLGSPVYSTPLRPTACSTSPRSTISGPCNNRRPSGRECGGPCRHGTQHPWKQRMSADCFGPAAGAQGGVPQGALQAMSASGTAPRRGGGDPAPDAFQAQGLPHAQQFKSRAEADFDIRAATAPVFERVSRNRRGRTYPEPAGRPQEVCPVSLGVIVGMWATCGMVRNPHAGTNQHRLNNALDGPKGGRNNPRSGVRAVGWSTPLASVALPPLDIS